MKISGVIKSELEAKEKECQKLEQEVVNLRKELEKCKYDLKMRLKCESHINALDVMLKKHKHSKDFTGVGYEDGQCSTSAEASKGDITFVSSNMNDHKKTFKVSNAPINKKDLNTTAESMKTPTVDPKKNNVAASTKSNHVDPKGKAKLDNDGFTRFKDMSKKFTRLRYVAPRRKKWNTFNNNN